MKKYWEMTNEEKDVAIELDWGAWEAYTSRWTIEQHEPEHYKDIISGKEFAEANAKLQQKFEIVEGLMDRKTHNWHLKDMPNYMRQDILHNFDLCLGSEKIGDTFTFNLDEYLYEFKYLLADYVEDGSIHEGDLMEIVFPSIRARCMNPETGKNYPTVFPALIRKVK